MRSLVNPPPNLRTPGSPDQDLVPAAEDGTTIPVFGPAMADLCIRTSIPKEHPPPCSSSFYPPPSSPVLVRATSNPTMEHPAPRSNDEKRPVDAAVTASSPTDDLATLDESLINASGHRQQLDRNFSLVSICCYAITAGNTWVSLGGSIVRDSPPHGKSSDVGTDET